MDQYEVIGDFLQSDLGLGRVGLRLSGYYAIIDEDLNIIEEGTKPDSVRLSETENQTSVSFFDEMDLIVSVVHTVDQIVIISSINSGELCGLCGSTNGSLISSDGVRVKDVANKLEIDVFASSWLVEPSEQILHEYRTECGKVWYVNGQSDLHVDMHKYKSVSLGSSKSNREPMQPSLV